MSVRKIGLFIITFLIVFGIKINSYFDISLITSFIVFLYYNCKNKNVYSFFTKMSYLLVIFVLYQLLLFIFNFNINVIFMGRTIRCLLCFYAIPTLYLSSNLTPSEKMITLLKVLLVHSLVVIVSAFIPSIQNFLKPISGFQLIPMMYRSTGLTNGYDFSGFICVIGLIVSLYIPKFKNKRILALIFFTSSLLTSRVSMLLSFITLMIFVFFGNNVGKKVKIAICIVLAILFIPVFGLVLYSTGVRDGFIVESFMKNDYLKSISDKLVYYYANTDFKSTFIEHYDLSFLTNFEIIFGTVFNSDKDPGYIQYIVSVGIVGLTITITIYLFMIKFVRRTLVRLNKNDRSYGNIIIVIILCILFLNLKNCYFLARHVTEILMVLLSIYTERIYYNKRGDNILCVLN